MTVPAPRRATYEDLQALPEQVVGEIVDGELVVSPRPAAPHAICASALGGTLMPPFQFGNSGPGGWWILDEPEVHFSADVVVPDLAGWRRERMPEPPSEAFFTLTPDWICEVLSPSTNRFDRTKKLPLYARSGIPHLWLLDPLAETLDVYQLQGGYWVLLVTHGGNDVVRAIPFDALEIDLKRLWGR
jgi:Uma2 family endonuclease